MKKRPKKFNLSKKSYMENFYFSKKLTQYSLLNVFIILMTINPSIGQEWDWQTSTNWSYKIYNDYMIRNNIWGATFWTGTGVGEQTIYANSERDWKIVATHTNGTGNAAGQVKAYPQLVRGWVQGGIGKTYPDGSPSPFVTENHGLNQRIDDLTVFNLYHKLELPRQGRYMALYDMYFFETDMPQLPYGSNKPDLAVMVFTNIWDDTDWMYNDANQHRIVTIGDRQWRLKISHSSNIVRTGGKVYVLYPFPEFINEEVFLDFKEMLHYLRDNENLDGNLRVSTIQLGIEIIDGGEYRILDFQADISDAPLDYEQVTGVSVVPESATIDMGESISISAVIKPEDAYYQVVSWSSADPEIAMVDHNGLVTGVGEGNTLITATTFDGSFQAHCEIKVNYAEVPVTGVKLDKNTLTVFPELSDVLNASIEPFFATNPDVVWHSENEEIATVDTNGVVTGVTPGTVNIVVTTVQGDYTDTCLVTVRERIFIDGVSIYDVSAEPQPENGAINIIDGDIATRWSANGYPQWVIIDYGESKTFEATRLWTFENRAYQYIIEASDDPTSGYTTIVDRSDNTTAAEPIQDVFDPVSARYIRITVTGAHIDQYPGTWVAITGFEIGEPTAVNTQQISNFRMYPNPANSQLNIVYPEYVTNGQIEILGMDGRVINQYSVKGGNVSIDISTLRAGIYIARITDGEKTVAKRFIIYR